MRDQPADLRLSQRLLLLAYNLLWLLALPFLALPSRTRGTLRGRVRPNLPPGRVDIWIQAASVGEARLAREILHSWPEDRPVSVLLTANTAQGLEVLQSVEPSRHKRMYTGYFPLDAGFFLSPVLRVARPGAVVLLEGELWPGLLASAARHGIPVLVLNARMSAKSMARYLAFPDFWPAVRPAEIRAVSEMDRCRYGFVFGDQSTEVMPNIKFDRFAPASPIPYVHNPLSSLIKANSQLAVLGSVRREEEGLLIDVVAELLARRSRSIVAVFPRHPDRVAAWKKLLDERGLHWLLRSSVRERIPQGRVVLWDTFGELEPAYALARAAFVGGSLAPCGGQNFLEALGQGITPCIGPYWESFAWAGRALVDQGLVFEVRSARELVSRLADCLAKPPDRESVHSRFLQYVEQRRGGTTTAIEAISARLPG
jgi:3-deoxy-D-manno-octulosonic-acid transferase